MTPMKRVIACCVGAALGLTELETMPAGLLSGQIVPAAEARIGHPGSPVSYAGVARRTARRVARRTALRIDTLPAGCIYGYYYGGHYYNCGGVYYATDGGTYVQIVIE